MINDLHQALLDLIGVLHSPRTEAQLIQKAGLTMDRALFPLLIRIGMKGPIGVGKLAEQAGRDHSTVSRQVAKLESLGLIARHPSPDDQRTNEASITEAGRNALTQLIAVRDNIVSHSLEDWSEHEKAELTRLMRKLADSALIYARETSKD